MTMTCIEIDDMCFCTVDDGPFKVTGERGAHYLRTLSDMPVVIMDEDMDEMVFFEEKHAIRAANLFAQAQGIDPFAVCLVSSND